MTTTPRFALSLIALVLLSACQRGERPVDSTVAAAEEALEAGARDTALRNAKIGWAEEKMYDLTGDGQPDRISVKAFGPKYDSLTVVLEIFDASKKLLFRDAWSSQRYFQYDYVDGKADTTIARIVLMNLKQLVADSAFETVATATQNREIDTMTVRYDLADYSVRAKHNLSDTTMLTTPYLDEIEKVVIAPKDITQAIDDVKGSPRYTYYAGGEVVNTIAWSHKLQRFILVFACC
jgi:hypothetical protein